VTWLDAVAVFCAGMAAGTINAVVGAGTLITFPTLLALGYPPVLANVTNTVGLLPGSASGAVGYRRELQHQGRLLVRLGVASAVGGLAGGLLLLLLPGSAFAAIVPTLIALSCLLVVAQPWIQRRVTVSSRQPASGFRVLWLVVLLCSVYGGYFGAAQSVLLIAILGIGLDETLQRVNAAKNVLGAIVNGVAALLFIAVAHVAWLAAGLIAAGSVIGGQLGALFGRRLPDPVLRGLVVLIGLVVGWRLLS
jgi:uncharacterized membrane protein YfcA